MCLTFNYIRKKKILIKQKLSFYKFFYLFIYFQAKAEIQLNKVFNLKKNLAACFAL